MAKVSLLISKYKLTLVVEMRFMVVLAILLLAAGSGVKTSQMILIDSKELMTCPGGQI